MMDNRTANKSHMIPCQSWVEQNDWSTASAHVPLLNPLPSSQHLSLGSSSDQRLTYNHLQASNQSRLSDLGTLSSRSNAHHAALYKASHISSNLSLFANAIIPNVSHIKSFAQQNPHSSSVLIAANQEKNTPPPSLPHSSQGSQPCRPQHAQFLPPHNPYKTSLQPPLSNQGLQDMPVSLPSCGQHSNQGSQRTSQSAFEAVNVDAGVAGYTHSHASAAPQEQPQWMPSSHCRGADNKSVPEAAAHPNKEPSQKGNISPVVSNEKSRSVLLLQRALLVQQLTELDNLLGSLPPDDGSDSQSQPTAIQCEQTKTSDAPQVQLSAAESKSPLLVDCSSSHASCEELNEASELDDAMSTAELEEEVNASSESEEIDPAYSPYSDDGLCDYLSDADGGSSDESSHSCPSTQQLKSSRPVKREKKSEGSLLKTERISPVKKIRATNMMKSSTVVLPSSNLKGHRVYDRKNYCPFCSKPMSKMSRHLESIHSDKAEVAAAFQYPKNSRERQKIWIRLIKQGNFAHNKDVLRTGEGQLAPRKRPKQTEKGEDFLHCLYCHGLYMRKALGRHMNRCPEKVKNGSETQFGKQRIALRCVLETIEDLNVSDGFRNVLSQMTYNDVTQAIMSDKIILQFGEQMIDHHGSNAAKYNEIRQNLRQMARLLLEAQKTTPLKKMEDFFLPSSFPHVVSAVNVLAGYDPENKTYSIPSLAIKLGYHLQKCCSIVEGNAMQSGNTSLAESARNFLSVYHKNWSSQISSCALSALRDIKQNREKNVPISQDVKCLHFHMEKVHLLAEKKLRECHSTENYAALTKVILARTILFNRRRAGEVATVQLSAFMSRKKSNLHDDFDISVSDLERSMCGFFTRVDIRGKCGRMVPVLLKPSFVTALELLMKVRETCGVPSENVFLFARPTALSPYSGSCCIQQYVKECGAKDPERLKLPKIRKHYANMLQLMNLDENEADQILGPNVQFQPLQQNCSLQVNDVQMKSEERFLPEGGHHAASWEQNELPGAYCVQTDSSHVQAHGMTAGTSMTPEFGHSGKKGSQIKGKHKWEDAEVCAVEKHMMHFIKGHKIPQKNDCVQCLEAEPRALRTRSWKGVKDYVRNRITALIRQSGTSQTSYTKSNCPGQMEPHTTDHFQ